MYYNIREKKIIIPLITSSSWTVVSVYTSFAHFYVVILNFIFWQARSLVEAGKVQVQCVAVCTIL